MSRIRWLRVLIAAFLVELGIAVISIPLQIFVNQTFFFGAVIVCCFAVAYVVTLVALRKLHNHLVLHGLLVGILATLLYCALVLATLGSATAAAEVYGTPLFVVVNALRVLGAIAGGYVARSLKPA